MPAAAAAEKADLINRLNNAVDRRNAASEEVLMLEAKVKQLQVGGAEAMQGGQLKTTGALAVCAASVRWSSLLSLAVRSDTHLRCTCAGRARGGAAGAHGSRSGG